MKRDYFFPICFFLGFLFQVAFNLWGRILQMGSWELIHFLFTGKVKTDRSTKNLNNWS